MNTGRKLTVVTIGAVYTRIITDFDVTYKWSAIDDRTYDLNGPIGRGETEQEAIDDLLWQMQEAGLLTGETAE